MTLTSFWTTMRKIEINLQELHTLIEAFDKLLVNNVKPMCYLNQIALELGTIMMNLWLMSITKNMRDV